MTSPDANTDGLNDHYASVFDTLDGAGYVFDRSILELAELHKSAAFQIKSKKMHSTVRQALAAKELIILFLSIFS